MTALLITNCTMIRHRPRVRRVRFRCGICQSEGHTTERIAVWATWKDWKEDAGQ